MAPRLESIEASVVDATWQEVSQIPPSRIPIEMGRASREQPDLLAFVFGSTDGMGPGVSELAGFIYFVVWRVFRTDTKGKIARVTAGAIQRMLEQNEQELIRLDGTDPQLIDAVMIEKLTRQPAVFQYVLDSIAKAEEDAKEPVTLSPEEKGALVLVLKTTIDALDEARESAGNQGS